jgi:bacterioferritin
MTQSTDLSPGPLTFEPISKLKIEGPFLTDIMEIRRRAREHMIKGAITLTYEGDVAQAIEILNQALATELVCVLRYRCHAFHAEGIHGPLIATEFLAHSNEEMLHVDLLAKRIRQLGGSPDFNPDGLRMRSHSAYEVGETLIEMIREDLIAERIAVDVYRELIRYFGAHDPTTRRVIEDILAQEEEHAAEMVTLLATIDPSKKPATDTEPLPQESPVSMSKISANKAEVYLDA